jgi:hypothetical protein
MSERSIPGGTKVFFGEPAKPMPKVMADALGQVVAHVPGICEAYIPETFIVGDTEARQVLVVGVASEERIPAIMEKLMGKMKLLLPPDAFMDVLPFASTDMPPGARVEKCRIFCAPKKPWWKIW